MTEFKFRTTWKNTLHALCKIRNPYLLVSLSARSMCETYGTTSTYNNEQKITEQVRVVAA